MIKATCEWKRMTFPAGEIHIQILTDLIGKRPLTVEWIFKKNEDIIELLLFADAVKRAHGTIGKLHIGYFPFGRQDRVANEGECFSLKVMTDLINSIGATNVVVMDPHSDVTPALLNNCEVIPQHEIFAPYINDMTAETREKFFLISPDGGALKKIYKLSPLVRDCIGVIECSKLRDTKTGDITETKIHTDYIPNGFGIIVDDICDGGRTFIEIAKKMKGDYGFTKIILCVTHGLFTKGLTVFENSIDAIYTSNGKVWENT